MITLINDTSSGEVTSLKVENYLTIQPGQRAILYPAVSALWSEEIVGKEEDVCQAALIPAIIFLVSNASSKSVRHVTMPYRLEPYLLSTARRFRIELLEMNYEDFVCSSMVI